VAAVVVLATAFVGWVVWAALAAGAPDVTAQVTGFVVPGPHRIDVEVTVAADEGRVTCPLRALGPDRDVVGATTVRVRVPSTGRVETTVPVRTRAKAVAAVLDECRRRP
jgi:type 1 fimbria pilin